MSAALLLYRLQQIDSRLGQVTTRLAAIHALLETNAELLAAKKCLEAAQKEQHDVEKALKAAELESATQRVKLEQAEASLYSGNIKSPKELQDLQNDIASLKRRLAVLEDSQLEAMMALEAASTKLETAQKELEVIQGKVISANAALQTEQIALQKEADNLNTQRQAVLPGINAETLGLYDSLRQKRSGMAVSTVSENCCDICGASLTPGFAQTVRTSTQLVHCPMCGRILYSN